MNLSIIIPCYNSESTILNLLSRIDDQISSLVDFYVEVIIINDGSIDNTKVIIEEFISGREWFSLINKRNEGAAKARTLGISQAKGEFIFFCDADDVISNDFIQEIKINTALGDVIYFSSQIVFSPAELSVLSAKISFNGNNIYSSPEEFLSELLTKGQWTAAVWTYVFRKNLIKKFDANFTDRIAHEDHLFTLKILFASKKIVTINKVLYNQVRTQGSLTNSKKEFSYANERYKAYQEAICFLKYKVSASVLSNYYKWSILSVFSIIESDSFSSKNIFYILFFKVFFSLKDPIKALRLVFRHFFRKE